MFTFQLVTESILRYQDALVDMHQKAFHGFPWFLQETKEEIAEEMASIIGKPGLKTFLALHEKQNIVGTLMYDTPSMAQLKEERGEELVSFTVKLMKRHTLSEFVWEREVFVDPKFYNKGVGTGLRKIFIQHLTTTYPDGVIVLTRMWDKNPSIIQIAKKFNFQRTGITVRSIQIDAEYEYWYKIIKH